MIPGYALLRLLWTRTRLLIVAGLFGLVAVIFASVLVLGSTAGRDELIGGLGLALANPLAHPVLAIWPMLPGCAVAAHLTSLLQLPRSWVLPGLQRRVAAPVVILGLLASLPLPLLMAGPVGPRLFVFLLGLAGYAIPFLLLEPTLSPGSAALPIFAVAAVVLLNPPVLAQLLAVRPSTGAVLALLAGGILARQFRPETARRRLGTLAPIGMEGRMRWFAARTAEHSKGARDWTGGPRRTLRFWLRAIDYETFGLHRHGAWWMFFRSAFLMLFLYGLFLGLIDREAGGVGFSFAYVVVLLLTLMYRPRVAGAWDCRPVPRNQRIRIAWTSSLGVAARLLLAIVAAAGVSEALLALIHPPLDFGKVGAELGAMVTAALVALPGMQWIDLRHVYRDPKGPRMLGRPGMRALAMLVAILSAVIGLSFLRPGRLPLLWPLPVRYAVVLGVAVLAQALFYRNLTRYFLHEDLV